MTIKQKVYFLWLVMENAYKLMENARTSEAGTQLIEQAYSKRKQLRLPFVNGMGTRQQVQAIMRMSRGIIDLETQVREPY